MRVIGIDPGYDRLGIAVMERHNGSEILIYSKCIETDRALPQPERLATLGRALTDLITEYEPDRLGIESLFFNKNQKTAIGVAEARGVVLYIAGMRGCLVSEFSPQEIKVAVTGHGGSDKRAVTEMIKRLVKDAPATALDDEYDAIAVGVTCLAHARDV